jgi:hypothetical protein
VPIEQEAEEEEEEENLALNHCEQSSTIIILETIESLLENDFVDIDVCCFYSKTKDDLTLKR